jgi:hypothetical protein
MGCFLARDPKNKFKFATLLLTTPANATQLLHSLCCLLLKIAIARLVGHGGSPGSIQNKHGHCVVKPLRFKRNCQMAKALHLALQVFHSCQARLVSSRTINICRGLRHSFTHSHRGPYFQIELGRTALGRMGQARPPGC